MQLSIENCMENTMKRNKKNSDKHQLVNLFPVPFELLYQMVELPFWC